MQITINYTPLPSGKAFHESAAKYKLARGGKGSGKTQALLMEAFMLSFEYPGNVGLLARETVNELQEIIIDPLLDLVPPELVQEYKKAEKKIVFTNGSMIYFRPLDESRKFKGMNLGWFGIDELDAARQEDWLQLIGQLRKPGVRHVAMGATNPTSMDHWIYETFVKEQHQDHEDFVFRTQDNKYLPKDFIEGLYATMPESWVRRYLEGQWGTISFGDRVYPDFSDKLHIYGNLQFNPSRPVVRTWDFGLKGHSCLLFQLRGNLGADFLAEVFRKDMTSRQFALVVQRVCDEMFPNAVFEDYGDVAGGQHESTSGRSPIEEISDELTQRTGHKIRILTDKIALKDSLDLVRLKLSQVSEGVTALRFHPRMRLTIEALNGGYVFKKDRLGNVVSDTPAADPIFEHLMDAMRYGIWHKFAYASKPGKKIVMPVYRPAHEGTAW